MFFLNLTAGEFLALLGGLGGLITALYLLDRAKRKKVVSTLRFWTSSATTDEKQTRRRMRDPWSLILQLVSLCLLLLAIAQLQWGTRERKERDHVLLVDTSAWSAARQNQRPGTGRIIDRERELAEAYIASLPERDRVMVVLADALATPATPFTTDRRQMNAALRDAQPGFSALNIDQALSYAQQAQNWSGGQPGEIVYIGPKQSATEGNAGRKIPNLRVLGVGFSQENVGILRMNVRRNEEAGGEWQASITLKNYGQQSHVVRLNTRFGATVFAPRILHLGPQQESVAEYIFVTSGAAELVAQIESPDSLATDNIAKLALPRNGLLRVAVYTLRPDVLRPLIEANRRLSATFYPPSQYQDRPDADVMLLDQISPRHPPAIASLWIQPSRENSPLPIKNVVENAAIINWNAKTPLANGLHAKETRLAQAEIFESFEGDLPVGNVAEGPVVVARFATSERPRLAVIGFDPLSGDMKFQVTTPLLFANIFHWLAPESLKTVDIAAARVGSATLTLDSNERADAVRVTTDSGNAVPFTIRDKTMQLFTGRPSVIRIASFDRERILSLTLPDVAEHEWKPPAASAVGFPSRSKWTSRSVTLWQWLAALGAIGLAAEWMLFGWRRIRLLRKIAPSRKRSPASRHETGHRELVSK